MFESESCHFVSISLSFPQIASQGSMHYFQSVFSCASCYCSTHSYYSTRSTKWTTSSRSCCLNAKPKQPVSQPANRVTTRQWMDGPVVKLHHPLHICTYFHIFVLLSSLSRQNKSCLVWKFLDFCMISRAHPSQAVREPASQATVFNHDQ